MTRIVRRILLILGLIVTVIGCSSPKESDDPGVLATLLAGTDDLELTYEVDAPVPSSGFGNDVRALVLRRLGAAQFGADVSEDDSRIHVVVDAAHARRVDELVTWTGTLLVFEVDPGAVFAPAEFSSRLVARQEGGDQYYEGTRAEILRAIETWTVDRAHRLLAEPIPSSTPTQPQRWRTRVVRTPAVGELGDGALVSWGDGPSLRIRAAKGSPAEAVIDESRDRKAMIVVARGNISLGSPSFDESHALYLSFGTGREAYARAQHERQLLTTPRLPRLRRVGAVGLPPNRALTLACLVVPVVLSLAWLVFVRRFDRAHPEPRWLVGVTFLLGAMSVVPAGLVEATLARASPWLDPRLATFGGRPFAFPLAWLVFTVVVGLVEEGSKRLAVQFAVRRREFDEPVDGIVYGIVASLGFAALENIRYFALGRLNAPLVVARCFMSVPAHMFFGALWGYALGSKLVNPKTRTFGWLLLAAACHGLFDALISTEGLAMLAVTLNVVLASAFVAVVRRALRHGVVTKEMQTIGPEGRKLFRVGRPGLFVASTVSVHLLAFGIFMLGAYYQLSHHRPSFGFVAGSALMLALLAVAALGVAATVPLDVAVDAYGVTFAGAARPWRNIRRFTAHPDRIELDCETGALLLGPARRPTIEAMATELAGKLGGDGTRRERFGDV